MIFKMKKMLKIGLLAIIGVVILIFGILAILKRENVEDESYAVMATNFVGYDFARAVMGESDDVGMLLAPGAEMHDFEPTPQDIINIKKADFLIYIGGESESWVERMIESNDIDRNKTLRLMGLVELKEEEVIEGMELEGEDEEEEEYDEHIWTSPRNAIMLVRAIEDRLSEIWPENKEHYHKNAETYISRLEKIDQQIREVVEDAEKKELIFGDRFPFRYFVDEYGLDYYAAFPGCSEQTEASSKTVAFLVDKAKQDGIKYILKIELTDGKLAKVIAEEVGAEVRELSAAHNISKEDFENGITFVDLMERNTEVLKEVLR